MKKKNWKTSAAGILAIIIAIATGANEWLTTEQLPDLGVVVASVLAGWGLVMAKDGDSKI